MAASDIHGTRVACPTLQVGRRRSTPATTPTMLQRTRLHHRPACPVCMCVSLASSCASSCQFPFQCSCCVWCRCDRRRRRPCATGAQSRSRCQWFRSASCRSSFEHTASMGFNQDTWQQTACSWRTDYSPRSRRRRDSDSSLAQTENSESYQEDATDFEQRGASARREFACWTCGKSNYAGSSTCRSCGSYRPWGLPLLPGAQAPDPDADWLDWHACNNLLMGTGATTESAQQRPPAPPPPSRPSNPYVGNSSLPAHYVLRHGRPSSAPTRSAKRVCVSVIVVEDSPSPDTEPEPDSDA